MKEVDECFRILRLRIEDQRPTPSLIVVLRGTSRRRHDIRSLRPRTGVR